MKSTRKAGLTLAITLAFVAVGHSQVFLTNGLVAYYPFNGNAEDESGNTNHGFIYGATLATDRFGNSNQAYYFAGDGSHILVQDSSSLQMTNSLTVSAWIKYELGGLGQPHIVDKLIFFLQVHPDISGGFFEIHRYPNSSSVGLGSTIVGPNHWTFLAGTYDLHTLKFYTNGLLANQTGGSFPLDRAPVPMAIGKNPQSDDAFKGSIDDVRIYERALSDSEIEQLFLHESRPVLKASPGITLSFANLQPGRSYQLQMSLALGFWTNFGSAFVATNSEIAYGHLFDANESFQTLFRLEMR